MTSTIQNISNIDQSKFFIKAPVAENRESQIQQSVPQEESVSKEDDYFNTKTILGSLAGLAAIGTGIWAYKKGKFKKVPKTELPGSTSSPSEPTDLPPIVPVKSRKEVITERIAELKKTIRTEYTARKQQLIDKMNDFDEFDDRIPFSSKQELQEILISRLNAYTVRKEKSEPIIASKMSVIKNRLAELTDNPEWKELKEIRKSMIKKVASSTSEDETKILNDKIIIANDLLINRVYPEEMENYTKFVGLKDEDAFKLLKKKFEKYEHFEKEFQSLQTDAGEVLLEDAEMRFTQKDGLKLKYIFPRETEIIETSRKAITKAQRDYEAAVRVHEKYMSKIQKLHEEFRESEYIKEYKNLRAELKSIESSEESKLAA